MENQWRVGDAGEHDAGAGVLVQEEAAKGIDRDPAHATGKASAADAAATAIAAERCEAGSEECAAADFAAAGNCACKTQAEASAQDAACRCESGGGDSNAS